jgi:hypothetical protein
MAELTADLNNTPRAGALGVAPIKAGVRLYKGGIPMVDASGFMVKTGGVKVVGLRLTDPPASQILGYNNTDGANGALYGRFDRVGVRECAKSATGTPTIANLGDPGYAEDDQTISTDPAAGPYFGPIVGVTDTAVEVQFDMASAPSSLSIAASSYAALQTLLADEAVVFNAQKRFYPVVGQGGAVVLSEDFPVGAFAGQEIVLIGTSATNTVTVPNDINTKTKDAASAALGLDDLIAFVWTGSVWAEIWRSVNNPAS